MDNSERDTPAEEITEEFLFVVLSSKEELIVWGNSFDKFIKIIPNATTKRTTMLAINNFFILLKNLGVL